ncbi:MAG: ABC transporter permease [Cyclobacteriaceae bacterium]|nr:ABC transporter permease [Cyclobacteriaceae bacterium]
MASIFRYPTNSPMFTNNLKVALRNLLRQKVYSLINIAGLAVGVASCLLIVLYVQHEFSYDRFIKDHDRIYRMVLERKYPNHSTFYAIIPHSYEGIVKRDFPEVEQSTNLFSFNNFTLSYKNERDEVSQFDEEAVLAGDTSFLKVFSFELVKGNRATALAQANEILLTETSAARFFGSADPLGKILSAGQQEYKVVGVLKDIPENSHFKFSAVLAATTFPFTKRENFTGFSAFTFFKLRPGVNPSEVEAKMPTIVNTYAAAQIERNLGKSWTDYIKEGNGYRYFLQPLAAIHLDPTHLEAQMKPSGNRTSVFIMIAVAILVLVIACINFMNLATARSAERAREVGVRKVMGSFRQHLIFQFLTESFVLSFVGVLLAVGFIYFSLPIFNSLTGKQLVLPISISSASVLVALAFLVGLLAGSYPSFVLSSFNPVVVLKGKFTGSQKGKWIRNGLVIFQFWISIILMIGTLVIQQQMQFMSEKSLGFDREQVLIVERGFGLGQVSRTMVEEFKRLPEVAGAAGSFAMPGDEGNFFGIQFQPEGSSEILTTKSMVVSDGLPEVLNMQLLDGRWFAQETNDSLHLILNEAAVKVLGIENPIGRTLMEVRQTEAGNVSLPMKIIGVVHDFNFMSLRDQVTPLVLQSNESYGGANQFIAVRVKSGQVPQAIKSVEAKWKELAPEQGFKFSFLDQNLDAQYKSEQQSGNLFAVFAGLAIFVSCIGLFALSAYITSLRTKEIGVRKVLGSSVTGVVLLLSKDFTRMILIAFALAVPIAWYVMESWWLQNFAYRIGISVWVFLAAGGAALIIAWITVSYQSIRAAAKNPISALRSE